MNSIQLVSDIGGTFARMALYSPEDNRVNQVEKLQVSDFDTFEDGLTHYLQRLGNPTVSGICVAAAGPLTRASVFEFLNNHWRIDTHAVGKTYDCRFELINDFTAQALGVGSIRQDDLLNIQSPQPDAKRFDSNLKLCVGPGTGFGAAALLDQQVLLSEAGHMSFAPLTEQEDYILSYLQKTYSRVSIERLISGNGLVNIANALIDRESKTDAVNLDSAKQVVEFAKSGNAVGVAAIKQFLKSLADISGDLALIWCASHIYLCGGMLPRLLDFVDMTEFKTHFTNKGRHGEICAGAEVNIVTNDQLGLFGCGVKLNT